jgi:hypothetical protein
MTQNEQLLTRLRVGPVEPLTALHELGIYRLGARIFELKAAGHVIEAERVTVKNRNGGTTSYARYTLKEA